MALSMAVVYKASTAAKPVYLIFSQFRNRGYPSRMVYLASLSLSLYIYIYNCRDTPFWSETLEMAVVKINILFVINWHIAGFDN